MDPAQEGPEIFSKDFKTFPATHHMVAEKLGIAKRRSEKKFCIGEEDGQKLFDSQTLCAAPGLAHLPGAQAQVFPIECVYDGRKTCLDGLHIAEYEGLGKKRVPQKDDTHLGRSRMKGNPCALLCHEICLQGFPL